jgi:hypothetical protein
MAKSRRQAKAITGSSGHGNLPGRRRERASFFGGLRNLAFIILVIRVTPIFLKFRTII